MITSYLENALIKDSSFKYNYKNIYECKYLNNGIGLNFGLRDASVVPHKLVLCCFILKLITFKKPGLSKSRESVHNLKIRKNMFVGCSSVLRGRIRKRFLDFFFFDFSVKYTFCTKKLANLKGDKVNLNLLGIQDYVKGVSLFNYVQNFCLPPLGVTLITKKRVNLKKFIYFLN
jgi:ribosomal protein L5